MQPILPSFQVPAQIEPGKAALLSFRTVNDTLQAYPQAECEWVLSNKEDSLASAAFRVSIPANGVSEEIKLTLPSLGSGVFTLSVTLTSGSKVLGENTYTLNIQ
jgi:hypothetical protein